MPQDWTKAKIEALLGEAETYTLEFKDADWLRKPKHILSKEVSKHISAMANAAGGDFIIGIREADGVADKVTPINAGDFSKERLQQIIDHNIQPTIRDLIIHRVEWDATQNEVVYVLEIPRSTQAHQANDFIYYQRRSGPTTEKMTDSEIRDVNSRKNNPKISMEFSIFPSQVIINQWAEKPRVYTLRVRVINVGLIYAKYIKLALRIPKNTIPFKEQIVQRTYIEEKEKVYDEIVLSNQTNGSFNPILPQTGKNWDLEFADSNWVPQPNQYIHWKVYADNASWQGGKIELTQIPISDTSISDNSL